MLTLRDCMERTDVDSRTFLRLGEYILFQMSEKALVDGEIPENIYRQVEDCFWSCFLSPDVKIKRGESSFVTGRIVSSSVISLLKDKNKEN